MKIEGHSWRYASGKYPAPDGIRVEINFRGHDPNMTPQTTFENHGRIFYHLDESHFSVIDPANGGYPIARSELRLIKSISIEAL